MALTLVACSSGGGTTIQNVAPSTADSAAEATSEAAEATSEATEATSEAEATEAGGDEEAIHIGIVTGSVSQSEDDRRGAEAFQEKYGEENVT
ncbi:MAG: DUF3798 domain-containing protein, partial [Lachnospiraceae bacterium]|nr:DUF3798 domain-containing protein [Lachnospiraceae bacterium]